MLTYLSNKMPFGAGPGSNPAREVLKLLAIGLSVVFLGCTDGSGPASGDRAASGDVIHPVRSGTDVTRGIAAPGPVRDDLFGSLPIIDSMIPMATECCTEPGQLTECWIQDAEDDGITCATDDDCDSGDCNTSLGVCTCTSDAECAEGVCTPSQICGPQYCNGFRQCSCFGGCETSNPDLPPADVCSSNGLVCCNGNYPLHPEVRGESFGEIGFCSTDSDCLLVSCEADEDCPDDGDACTSERCNVGTGSCMHILDGAACDDDNVCTEDVCDQVDGCIHTPLTGPCDDGNECTENETCDSGFCVGTVTECDDGNVCTEDSCDDAIGCVYFNNTDACDDGDACTIGDICADGVCDGAARECDDGNDCTDDVCDAAAGCLYTDVVGGCDDGDACTEGDVCVSGICQSGGPLDCDDGNVCTDDACDNAAGCVYVNNTGACSDNNACTDGDVCADGVCASGAVITCDDGNQCTNDACDPATGTCDYTPVTDGTACDFGGLPGQCKAGECEGL